ncbi:MAG: Uma2 family endonuclease [Myxacorys chilensis ATA2-1-KO14]|jgi:Uma2 family endonuclease|nr:Uma2 family endonuclease [Myxacorys chilensis ATA2-1-KO14]
MVATQPPKIATTEPSTEEQSLFSLEDFMLHPPNHMEWIDGELVETTGMTVRHGTLQSRLSRFWGNHVDSQKLGGEVVTETACRTLNQGRRPDVAYMSPELVAQYGQAAGLPRSFPLIAEIASPDDSAEGLFAKAIEYLESGCQEVWLVFPEARIVLAKTAETAWQLFNPGDAIATQTTLQGFSIPLDELLA